jgi:hypothetical protein
VTKHVEAHLFHTHETITISYKNVIFSTDLNNNSKINALQIQSGTDSVPNNPATYYFIPKEKIKDYETWEKDYEEILKRIGEAKLDIENCARTSLEGKL